MKKENLKEDYQQGHDSTNNSSNTGRDRTDGGMRDPIFGYSSWL